ncbi:MAG: hypothetical protein DMG49_05400 [Acidobacteria bacterium]|nr:MAG: hypothetical protein DMG49_05400 [Acidobacteriota bacterium]
MTKKTFVRIEPAWTLCWQMSVSAQMGMRYQVIRTSKGLHPAEQPSTVAKFVPNTGENTAK